MLFFLGCLYSYVSNQLIHHNEGNIMYFLVIYEFIQLKHKSIEDGVETQANCNAERRKKTRESCSLFTLRSIQRSSTGSLKLFTYFQVGNLGNNPLFFFHLICSHILAQYNFPKFPPLKRMMVGMKTLVKLLVSLQNHVEFTSKLLMHCKMLRGCVLGPPCLTKFLFI